MKELCKCGQVAVWLYMPGYMDGSSPFHCDGCVNRGCSCNHRYVDVKSLEPDNPVVPFVWIEEGKVWASVDEKGRQFPCVEYDYSEEGYDIEETDVLL